MAEDRCICCGDIVPEGRMVCPNCEAKLKDAPLTLKPMKNLSHGEMVQIAEGKKNKTPRYIDANRLIDLATHEGAYGYVDVHDIYSIPPADVVEVKHGKWMAQKGGGYRCSECKHYALDERDGNLIHVSAKTKFCPNCGADMRGEHDAETN